MVKLETVHYFAASLFYMYILLYIYVVQLTYPLPVAVDSVAKVSSDQFPRFQ